jgi:hypothetical protein
MQKGRDLLPGGIGDGPEAQKSQTPGGGHLRQGRGFQVQNRMGQSGQGLSLSTFMDDAAGGDQTAGVDGKPRRRQNGPEVRQGQRGGRGRDRLQGPGVGVIVPEALSQDQIAGRQSRGQAAPEPQRNEELRPAAVHQGLAGAAAGVGPHPGQGHHPWSRLPDPGRQPQVPASLGPHLTQKRPHFLGQCGQKENPAGSGGARRAPAC